jgi:hypothetical protein
VIHDQHSTRSLVHAEGALHLTRTPRSLAARAGGLLLRAVLLIIAAWGSAALWIDGPGPEAFSAVLAAAYAAATLWLLLVLRGRFAAPAATLLAAAVLAWWLSIPPRNDRDWTADNARLTVASVEGDRLVVDNVRDFRWRSDADFDERWERREYDLATITGLDLFLCYWGPREIAHTILSWEFADGRHLAISIETRKERGEEYSALRGFFRQYELYYVVADERDVIRVRTDCRGEEVYLYRLRTPPERARRMLLDYLASVNDLSAHAAWYNAASQNCTTRIFGHVDAILGEIPLDFRIFRNGRIDEMLHEEGVINAELSFEAQRAASRVGARAAQDAAAGGGDSGGAAAAAEVSRAGLPARPPSPAR